MPRIRRALATVVVVLGVLGAVPAGTVSAHAELRSSSPANQSILESSPPEIVLRFSETIDPVSESIRVVDGNGTPVELGPVDQALGDDTLRAPLIDPIDDGTYVVGWQAISADSHKVRGAFTFSVGAASPTAPGVIDELFAAGGTSSSESLVLGVGRFASFAGIGVLVGALLLALVLVPELVGTQRLGRLLVGAAIGGVIGTALMFAGQARMISGSFFQWGEVVGIQSGRWWLARIAAIGLFALFIPVRTYLTPRIGRVQVGAAGIVVFAVVAAGGHAVAGDNVMLGYASTVIHLAAMSLWFGGLVLLVAGIPRGWFWWTASQFSPWALGSVVVLAATGSINAWRQLGSFDGVTDSVFGRWLVVKLVLVVAVVAVAFFSRRMSRSDDEELEESTPAGDAVAVSVGAAAAPVQEPPPALRRTVMLEVAGIALILMATAGLVNSPPPPSAATTESASAVVENRIVQVELEPAVTGGTEMHVYVSSPGGGLDRADEITVSASLPSADLGPLDIEVVPAGPNHVIGVDVDLPVPGLWTFEVVTRFGEFDQVVFTVQIPVSD